MSESKTPRTDDESTLAAMVRELDAKLTDALAAKERAEELAHQCAMGVQDTIALHAKEVSDLKAELAALAAKLAESEAAERSLSEQVKAMDAALADAERDAARYRWLRGDTCPDHSIRWTQWEVRRWDAPFWTMDLRRKELDAAIDEAMGAKEKGDA